MHNTCQGNAKATQSKGRRNVKAKKCDKSDILCKMYEMQQKCNGKATAETCKENASEMQKLKDAKLIASNFLVWVLLG